jgi:hypothetical protein
MIRVFCISPSLVFELSLILIVLQMKGICGIHRQWQMEQAASIRPDINVQQAGQSGRLGLLISFSR